MNRLAPALLAAAALAGFDGIDAAPIENDAPFAPAGEIRFGGAVMEPAGTEARADARSAASLQYGQAIRRGSTDSVKHDPPRTVVVLPPSGGNARVVVITYD
jgi:hypothetical protein